MTVRDLLVAGTEELSRAGVPSPRVDAEWLLAHALGVSRTDLYADGGEAPADRDRVFRELVSRARGTGAARVRARRVGIPAGHAARRSPRSDPAARDRGARRALPRADRGSRRAGGAGHRSGVGGDRAGDRGRASRARASSGRTRLPMPWRLLPRTSLRPACASSSSRASCSRDSKGPSTSSSPTRRTWRPRTSLHYRPRSASTSRARR